MARGQGPQGSTSLAGGPIVAGAAAVRQRRRGGVTMGLLGAGGAARSALTPEDKLEQEPEQPHDGGFGSSPFRPSSRGSSTAHEHSVSASTSMGPSFHERQSGGGGMQQSRADLQPFPPLLSPLRGPHGKSSHRP